MSRLAILILGLSLVFSSQAIAQPGDGLADASAEVVSSAFPVQKDPGTWIEEVTSAFHEKNWSFVVGAILMFLVWGVRRAWSAITKQATSETAKKALPWIALGLGVLLDISTGLINGIAWWKAILSGLVSGGSAIALWEAVFKHLFPSKD